ncbi:3-hydroxyacyl-CoA dehydrogenase NAD-binding domain-containing protein [Methylocapsa palsarum]|uniref:3-hydroxyacyl-CoA dehydrogenase / enoyl-CoA hydratase / 3-hydroxybutyryl-CoA epimerase n=1 Tax=Methylocapsa palsarum TaxID=1612308 RepID=A0A1I3W2A7_9HYPH|nr:3-hydroxyacyl-CoA dehydrogenase NAD-binding domain-containing protein [Methylocapsa palsarum]SFK00636.1 3-hydroxyacyl-CoA dehydrogenase / enoyl-CoA hydratase / 3-hydroxybutyryl-CoA epimerase [Methylocapsa palsarum]
MNLTNFRFETGADGIAVLTWDMPGRSMNVITPQVIEELERVVDHVGADAAIKGCVIASGKAAFSGGADLSMLQGASADYEKALREKGEEEAARLFFEASRRLSLVYRKLETCGKPFAAAINGLCLGGAFELALACHYRVIADDDKARVGLPEIKVGLFPGAGGSQRVARLMQTGDALQMLFKGEQIRPKAAKTMNLIHEVAPPADVLDRAKAFIAGGGKGVAPWDEKGFKAPSGKVFSPQGMMVWPAANAIYRRETYDNYPAAKAILHSVYEGLQLPMDLALKVESRWFAKILRSPEAAAMIRSLFISMGELNKGARRPTEIAPTSIKKVGVLGAGFMGAGIAYVSAGAGLEVILIDKDQAAADKGKAYCDQLISSQVLKGRAKGADKEALLGRIAATDDYSALQGCDLVIEAVFEDRAIKAEVIGKAGAALGPKAIFASNTSTLPITSLAENYPDPEKFIGVHFFSPVEKMLLVEIILGKKTGDAALAAAIDYVRAIKKTPIVVNDSRGFFANRCVTNYIREAQLMLIEGVPAAMIENVARMAGMPVGPLALNDEVAIDLAYKILEATKKDLGADAIDPAQERLLKTMVVDLGRLGRKNGKGFYDYPEKRQKSLWPGLAQLQETQLDPGEIDIGELKQRFLAIQALEAARAVEEGVVTDPREADVGSIIGFGFAPFTGGVLSYIDGMGAAAFVAICDRLRGKFGPRFAPPAILVDMAKQGGSFYATRPANAA